MGCLRLLTNTRKRELRAAVEEAARYGNGAGHGVAVHATGEPGTGLRGGRGGGVGRPRLQPERRHDGDDESERNPRGAYVCHWRIFSPGEATGDGQGEAGGGRGVPCGASSRSSLRPGVPMAVGSDVGPFPHGTQARELELMVAHGMSAEDVLRADPAERGESLLGVGRARSGS